MRVSARPGSGEFEFRDVGFGGGRRCREGNLSPVAQDVFPLPQKFLRHAFDGYVGSVGAVIDEDDEIVTLLDDGMMPRRLGVAYEHVAARIATDPDQRLAVIEKDRFSPVLQAQTAA